jgi:hypothetical protein
MRPGVVATTICERWHCCDYPMTVHNQVLTAFARHAETFKDGYSQQVFGAYSRGLDGNKLLVLQTKRIFQMGI